MAIEFTEEEKVFLKHTLAGIQIVASHPEAAKVVANISSILAKLGQPLDHKDASS